MNKLPALLILLFACGGPINKQEARTLMSDGASQDYCESEGWYGDGTCDEFCPLSDTDCQIQCRAYPACPPSTVEVQTCPQDASCHQVSLCGATLTCMDTANCAAYPSCPAGTAEVEACPQDASCHEVSLCGATIYCSDAGVQCLAYPSCPQGWREVVECPQDAGCQESSICGTTIRCTDA